MVTENELMYLVLLVVLTLVIHFLLATKGPRRRA